MKHIGLCALFAFFLIPVSSQAYLTTDQEAFTVNGKLGIYTIEFAFGHGSHEVHIPVAALRGGDIKTDAVQYVIEDNDNTPVSGGTAAGIVLSNVPVENGMYVIPKGKKATFTLLVLYTPSADDPYRLQVTHLPFSFDGTQELKLNPSELQYYRTPLESLIASAS